MMEFLSFNKSIDIEKMLKEHTLTNQWLRRRGWPRNICRIEAQRDRRLHSSVSRTCHLPSFLDAALVAWIRDRHTPMCLWHPWPTTSSPQRSGVTTASHTALVSHQSIIQLSGPVSFTLCPTLSLRPLSTYLRPPLGHNDSQTPGSKEREHNEWGPSPISGCRADAGQLTS